MRRAAFAVGMICMGAWAATCASVARADDDPPPLAKGVRGLITHTSGPMLMNGRLEEFSEAYCTPVHYNHRDLDNRAAQFYYLWDEDALYIGLRALDRKQANPGKGGAVFNGDAVEFYLDTRAKPKLRDKEWSEGAIHFFFSPFEEAERKPRLVMRSGIATSNKVLEGVQHAATSFDWGYEEELLIPWANFPAFKPVLSALLALDAELCSGEGAASPDHGARVDRTFAYGSPLSVQQPASLGLVQLVKDFDPDYLPAAGPAAFPMWVDTPWVQAERAQVQAVVAIPPAFTDVVGTVEVRIHDSSGKIVKTLPAKIEPFGPQGKGFVRAVARWSIDDYAPNTFQVSARVVALTDKTVVVVTPRLVQEAIIRGR